MDALFFALRSNRQSLRQSGSSGTPSKKSLSFKYNLPRERTSFTDVNPPVTLQPNLTTSPVLAAMLVNNYWPSSNRTTQSSLLSLTKTPPVAPVQLNYKGNDESCTFDGCTIPLSSHNCGTKQLSNTAIVHLRRHDTITVVVPPMNPSKPVAAQQICSRTLIEFCKVSLEGVLKINTLEEKESFVNDHPAKHIIERWGKDYHELNVKIEYYDKKYSLSELLPTTVTEQYIDEHGKGFSVSLNGYPRRKFVLIEFISCHTWRCT